MSDVNDWPNWEWTQPSVANEMREKIKRLTAELASLHQRADLADAATSLALVENSKTIKQLNDAEHELAAMKERTRWIPVSERYSAEELTVLITGGDEVVETGTRYQGDWWQQGRKVKGVTHWQPLPEPPEAENE